jgi:cation transport ATPase
MRIERDTAVFGALLLLQGLLVGAIPMLAPSRSPAINGVLSALAVAALAAGPALVLAGRPGRVAAAVVCLVHFLAGLALAILVAASASYLYGIYGHHGSSLGAIALAIAAVALILFWLIPGHVLHYLRRDRAARPAPAPAGEGAAP